MPKVSFIVSCYDRPDHLACLLLSLKLQTFRDFEVLVMDNSEDGLNSEAMHTVIQGDERFQYINDPKADCYDSANCGASASHGFYLCFPSDDDYYCPRFLELMLQGGGEADLIYCNYVDDSFGNECAVMNCLPKLGHIDKGGFLLKRELFKGFKGPFNKAHPVNRPADGWLIEDLVRQGVRCRKVDIVGWVHN